MMSPTVSRNFIDSVKKWYSRYAHTMAALGFTHAHYVVAAAHSATGFVASVYTKYETAPHGHARPKKTWLLLASPVNI